MPEEEPYLEYLGYKQNTREIRNMSEFELTYPQGPRVKK
jgi:hypothetical protein